MSGDPPPRPVSVRGGTGGIVADAEQLVALARLFGSVASQSASASVHLHGYLFGESLALAALLDPVGGAAFEGELTWALDGFQGLSWAAASAGLADGELRLAAAAYERTEQGVYGDALRGLIDLPAAAAAAINSRPLGGPLAGGQAALSADPGLADLVIDGGGLPSVLEQLAEHLPDGHGVVRHAELDLSAVGREPPRRLTDLMTDLARRSDDPRHGEIDVRILTMADGSRRAIVDITGTKSWDPAPTHDITSLSTNARALAGERTAYEQGVLAAMHAAGVRRTDDVMLVGHSEGGMVAVTAARDATADGRFNVTHVVTAGAPIGNSVGSVPSTIKVLALENAKDVVPHLDGVTNPDQVNVTTVTGDRGDSTILGNHDIAGSYRPIAGDAQASHSRSIRDFLDSAQGYFQAESVETHTYQIQRS